MLNFPDTPTAGQVFQGYTWDGEKWLSTAGTASQVGVIAIQVFTASGTYVPSANMTSAIVEVRGSGGGGGGSFNASSSAASGGAGGGQGSLSRSTLTAAQIGASQVVTIGNAGTASGVGASSGGNGADCSFGSLVIGKGGGGGQFSNTASTNGVPGPGGVAGTGQFTEPGISGGAGATGTSATALNGGAGGGAGGGNAGLPPTGNVGNGANATGFGAGGGGGSVNGGAASGAATGGAGSKGYVCVTEFGIAAPVGTSTGFVMPRGYLAGLTLSTAGASATFGVAAGVATDSLNVAMMQLAAAIAKTTAAWAVGNNAGGLDTGAIAASTWYHVHLIRRPDTGVVDVLVSLSATAPTLPASYTQFRRIGSMKTNASSQWTKFIQNGDLFSWDVAVAEPTIVAPGTAGFLKTLTTPTGIKVLATLAVMENVSNVAANWIGAILITDPAIADTVANSSDFSMYSYSSTTSSLVDGSQMQVMTNISAQVRVRIENSSSVCNIIVIVHAWRDRRGKDD